MKEHTNHLNIAVRKELCFVHPEQYHASDDLPRRRAKFQRVAIFRACEKKRGEKDHTKLYHTKLYEVECRWRGAWRHFPLLVSHLPHILLGGTMQGIDLYIDVFEESLPQKRRRPLVPSRPAGTAVGNAGSRGLQTWCARLTH